MLIGLHEARDLSLVPLAEVTDSFAGWFSLGPSHDQPLTRVWNRAGDGSANLNDVGLLELVLNPI